MTSSLLRWPKATQADLAARGLMPNWLEDERVLLSHRRRPTRQLLALAQLLTDLSCGDEVATPVTTGSALLVGRITGEYHFEGRSPAGIVHRRPVRWNRLVLRSALVPAFALQDVRPLFRVRLASSRRLSRR